MPNHPLLSAIKGDVNDINSVPIKDIDTVIHLSSIANDPCGDLNPKLTWETSCLATMQLADKAKRLGVKQFIYASSGSVYGVKKGTKSNRRPHNSPYVRIQQNENGCRTSTVKLCE